MVGLDIRVKNEHNQYLYKIFKGIDFSNFAWNIIADDFLYLEDGNIQQNFFMSNVLTGEEFLENISKDSYYMIFADIKAYPIGNACSEIKTFKDFIESNCELILLCTDSTFIEFYSKDKCILEKVYDNCIKNNFEYVQYVSIEDALKRNIIAW